MSLEHYLKFGKEELVFFYIKVPLIKFIPTPQLGYLASPVVPITQFVLSSQILQINIWSSISYVFSIVKEEKYFNDTLEPKGKNEQ